MNPLSISRTDIGDNWAALAVTGEIDLATVDDLDKEIKSFFTGETKSLAIDLTGADFMDSSGLRCLIMADRAFAESPRNFALVVGPGPISRLIDLSGVDSTVNIVSTLDELG